MSKCDSFGAAAGKVWKQYGGHAKLTTAAIVSGFTGADPATILKVENEIEDTVGDVVSKWNDLVGNSGLRIGPRSIRLGKKVSGTLESVTDRVFITPHPLLQEEVNFKMKHTSGKGKMECTICAIDDKGKAKCLAEFTYKSGEDNDGDSKMIKLRGTLGRVLVINLDGKSLLGEFGYEIVLSKAVAQEDSPRRVRATLDGGSST
jgi:hypothetical protein